MRLPTDEDEDRDPFASLCGSTVGPWLILDRFDSGSFGVVFRAQRAGHPEAGPFAVKMAKQPWDERFEREVAGTLEDPAFTRPVAERVAEVELFTFRGELAAEVADLIRYHRGRLRALADRLLAGGEEE